MNWIKLLNHRKIHQSEPPYSWFETLQQVNSQRTQLNHHFCQTAVVRSCYYRYEAVKFYYRKTVSWNLEEIFTIYVQVT